MNLLRRFAAAAILALGFSGPALATPDSIDYTDLWFVPAESGWGVNVIQQGNTLFATLFVYGSDQSPRWFVASDLKPVHITTDPHIEVSGDTARQRCRLITCVRSADGSRNDLVNTGWFHASRVSVQTDLPLSSTMNRIGSL